MVHIVEFVNKHLKKSLFEMSTVHRNDPVIDIHKLNNEQKKIFLSSNRQKKKWTKPNANLSLWYSDPMSSST